MNSTVDCNREGNCPQPLSNTFLCVPLLCSIAQAQEVEEGEEGKEEAEVSVEGKEGQEEYKEEFNGEECNGSPSSGNGAASSPKEGGLLKVVPVDAALSPPRGEPHHRGDLPASLQRAVGAAPSKKAFGARHCNDSKRERNDGSGGGEGKGEGEGEGGEDGEEEYPSDCVEHILSDKGL